MKVNPMDLGVCGVEQLLYAGKVNFNDTNVEEGIALVDLPKNVIVTRAVCVVGTAFNAATTNVLTVGTNSDVDDILAADDWYAFSKEERARRYIRERCDDPERIWFIGDAVHDAEVADACGCLERCILVPLGHQSREDLVRTGAIVCDGFDVVPGLIISTCS